MDKPKTQVFEVPYYECNKCSLTSIGGHPYCSTSCGKKFSCKAKQVGIQRTTVEVIYTQKR